MQELLSTQRIIELLVSGYTGESGDKLGEVVATLCGAKSIKPDKKSWELIRFHMSSVDFRNMLVKMMEGSLDRPQQLYKLLDLVYDSEEDFEVAETLRLVLQSNWILDILPSKKKLARKTLNELFVRPFPFTKKVVDEFVEEVLRLEPLPVHPKDELVNPDSVSISAGSSDSDIESRGSLDDFVVDSEEDGEEDSGSAGTESELSSNYSEDEPVIKKKKRKLSSSSEEESPKVKKSKNGKSKKYESSSSSSNYSD